MTQAQNARALLLDLDGTIADTLPHIFDAYRHAVAPWADTPPTDAEVEATFGPSERECIGMMVPRADLDEAEARFHAYYEGEQHAQRVRLIDGINAVIDRARALGWKVGIFTGKGRRSARFSLAELGLADRIDCLVSGDDVSRPKPDPEGVFQASETLGVPVGRILLAGDSPADVRAGKAAGALTAAVLWAAFQPDRLREEGADWTCERVDELMAAVESLGVPRAGTQIRGVIFDMDGVLVESEPFIAEAAIRMFAEKGVAVRPEEFRPFVGMGEDRFLGGVAEARGVSLDLARDKAHTYDLYLELIRGRLHPLPGAREFVAECRRRGLSVAVASSADAVKVEGNLREIGLHASSFDAVVNGGEVGRKKPAPDIFLEAARRIGLDPANCLVVEDAVAGVAAAKTAGSRCLAVTSTFAPEQLAAADWIAPDLAHVPPNATGW